MSASSGGTRYHLRRDFRDSARISTPHHQNRFPADRRRQRKSSPYDLQTARKFPDRRPNKAPRSRRFMRYRPYGRTRPTRSSPWDGEKTPQQTGLNLDQEQEKRASYVKKKMQEDGIPHAPFNTTQFLMEDHKVRDPEFGEVEKKANNANSTEADILDIIDFCASPNNEDFQQRQFIEAYENVHAERLSSMTKTELVQEYLLLEAKAEELEKKLRDIQGRMSSSESDENEVSRLKDEVDKLRQENMQLRSSTRRKPKSAPNSPARVSFALGQNDKTGDG